MGVNGGTIRLINWSLHPAIQFRLPQRQLSVDLLDHLNGLNPGHPILTWLSKLSNPATIRKRARALRKIEDRGVPPRRTDRSYLEEVKDSLVREFEDYIASFGARLRIVEDMQGRPSHFVIGPTRRNGMDFDYRLLAAVLALLSEGRLWSLKKCEGCGKWMQARQKRQFFCGTACRQKAFQKIERVRLLRNEQRRKRYAKDVQARREQDLKWAEIEDQPSMIVAGKEVSWTNRSQPM